MIFAIALRWLLQLKAVRVRFFLMERVTRTLGKEKLMAEKDASYKSKVKPHKGAIGNTYVVPGPEFNLKALAEHARLASPQEARQILRDLVDSIPDAELKNFVGAQLTVAT